MKTIHINESVHRKLKMEAARLGLSLSDTISHMLDVLTLTKNSEEVLNNA